MAIVRCPRPKLGTHTIHAPAAFGAKLLGTTVPRSAVLSPALPGSAVLGTAMPDAVVPGAGGLSASTVSDTYPRTTSLYISSSMFSGFDPVKLSSRTQNPSVLYYRGSTVEQILSRLKDDPKFQQIDPSTVNKIFVMCGTNNVDKILGLPFSKCSSFITSQNVQNNQRLLDQTFSGFNDLNSFLHQWNPCAMINFINVLPRASRSRNIVINQLNHYLERNCYQSSHNNFINTEIDRHLFSRFSYRRSEYFSKFGTDNVHLNQKGIVRLCKHLKYIAHN